MNPGGGEQAHAKGSPSSVPMGILNGYLTANPSIHAPTTGLDGSPVEFRRYVNASGFSDVQLWNGLQRRTAQGVILPIDAMAYDYAAVPSIPGQQRDNYGGHVPHGVGIEQYQYYVQQTTGNQSQATGGGPRKISGTYLYNPGTS